MASLSFRGAACAAAVAFACTAGPAAAEEPASPAATLWQLRSGLNVAALACRGEDEAAIVAGYNRLLADHRVELASAYQAVSRDYGDPAAFDAAMTRLYNTYAQPAAQAALCANAGAVLSALGEEPSAALTPLAGNALALLSPAPARLPVAATTQLAVVSIPQILDERDLPGE